MLTINRRVGNALGFIACAVLMGYALYAQHVLGLAPCPLCIFQRVAVITVGVLFLIAALHGPSSSKGALGYAVVITLATLGGIGISARAGFDSYGASRFLTAMQRNADVKGASPNTGIDPHVADFLSSHPATPERVRNAVANARQFSGPGNGERDHDAYLGDIEGMVYGEDPSEGFARGRHFLHPKLGFTFTAPPGFSLDNTAQAVLGLKEGGGEAMRLDVVSVPAEQRLSDYLKSGWIDNVDSSSTEDFSINGFPAATASAKGERWSFRLFAVRFGSDVYRFIFAARELTPANDKSFREAVMTFRRMSVKESAGIKPLHIRVVAAKAGDTIDTLAQRMATDHKLERFLLLNGLQSHDKVKAGQKVKVVME